MVSREDKPVKLKNGRTAVPPWTDNGRWTSAAKSRWCACPGPLAHALAAAAVIAVHSGGAVLELGRAFGHADFFGDSCVSTRTSPRSDQALVSVRTIQATHRCQPPTQPSTIYLTFEALHWQMASTRALALLFLACRLLV